MYTLVRHIFPLLFCNFRHPWTLKMIPNTGPGGDKASKTHSYISQTIPLHVWPLVPSFQKIWRLVLSLTALHNWWESRIHVIDTKSFSLFCFVFFGKQVKSYDWVINYDLVNFIDDEKDMVVSSFWSECQAAANFSTENLICLTMMLVICRPLLQESSNNRLRKGPK